MGECKFNNLVRYLSGTTNALILGAIIGAMVSSDLGGPINKAAYAFCIADMANGNLIPYAAFASVKMVSAFSVTGATMIGIPKCWRTRKGRFSSPTGKTIRN